MRAPFPSRLSGNKRSRETGKPQSANTLSGRHEYRRIGNRLAPGIWRQLAAYFRPLRRRFLWISLPPCQILGKILARRPARNLELTSPVGIRPSISYHPPENSTLLLSPSDICVPRFHRNCEDWIWIRNPIFTRGKEVERARPPFRGGMPAKNVGSTSRESVYFYFRDSCKGDGDSGLFKLHLPSVLRFSFCFGKPARSGECGIPYR